MTLGTTVITGKTYSSVSSLTSPLTMIAAPSANQISNAPAPDLVAYGGMVVK